jgi:hypothetical protein
MLILIKNPFDFFCSILRQEKNHKSTLNFYSQIQTQTYQTPNPQILFNLPSSPHQSSFNLPALKLSPPRQQKSTFQLKKQSTTRTQIPRKSTPKALSPPKLFLIRLISKSR